MNTHRMRWLASIIALSAALVPVAVACYQFTPGAGPSGTESSPCAGVCMPFYWSCPGSDSCPSGSFSGAWACPCTTITVNCTAYSGGTPVAGCCTGGVRLFAQPFPPMTTSVTSCAASGNCTGWVFPV